MKCEEALDLLDEYVDGTLPEARHQELELHVASCAACRAEEESLRALVARAAGLPGERRPARDLWPEIAGRIESLRVRRFAWPGPVLLAAAAAVILALAVVVGGRLPSRPGSAPAPSGTPELASTGGAEAVRKAEADYLRATGELMAALDQRRGSLSPETQKEIEDNLTKIDTALREVRVALEKEPGNAKLNKMLASTHQKKLDLLLRLIRLSSQIS